MTLWTLIALVMMGEAFLHYFPWMKLLKGKDLPRVPAYALGVLGLMVPFSMWLLEQGEVEILKVLWMVIIAGGLSVLALYGLDRYIELEWRDIEASERERASRNDHGKKS